jgi:ATP-binding cassette subfamily A (ABC1) protein 3
LGEAKATLEAVRMSRMPYPEYSDDGFIYAIQFGLPLFIMLALLFTAVTIVRVRPPSALPSALPSAMVVLVAHCSCGPTPLQNLVHEKERRLKESMKMMGLKNWVHWLAWFLQAFGFLFVRV